ncbi:terminase large subunit domain-containing protein [Salinibacter ruber]|uniref:terminase large subunit domain-containing protein n=1 Tax=Salinibacter ruber TaxID=146919 RepID=UPI002169526B|nr:terminase family protein [Salinibacter ruber]
MSPSQTETTPSTSSKPLRRAVDAVRSKASSEGQEMPGAVTLMERAGLAPDPWQQALLTSDWERALLNCARQSGKTTASAALALEAALEATDNLVLILAPARRQSKEFLRSVRSLYRDAAPDVGLDKQSELRLRLENESRIIALPGKEGTVRGYTADLVIADEAARVPDSAYVATRPMLAVSGGRFVGLSTPAGQRGWFYTAWSDPSQDWERVEVTGHDCPRMTEDFLEQERQEMGDWQFRNEYLCEFQDTTDQLFATDDIEAALTADTDPLFAEGTAEHLTDTEPLFDTDSDR